MSFDYAGTIKEEYEREHKKAEEVVEEDKMGPMIICVDTSGSMSGEPEQVAKAVALALAMKSIEHKRDCYLISFSTIIETYNLSSQRGLPVKVAGSASFEPAYGSAALKSGANGSFDQASVVPAKSVGLPGLLDFLQMSFHGGTDAAPALHHALKMMETEQYERADLLMISDFDMPGVTPELKQQMHEARERKCKFYALNIGAQSGQTIRHEDFDDEWQYDPGTMGIKELNRIVAGGGHG